MQFGPYRNRHMSTLIGLLFWCLLFEGAICISATKDRKTGSPKAVDARPAPAKLHAASWRLRRRLQTDSNDQSNSLDVNDVQYQEYQGVFGRPGVDFPVLSSIPITKFNCKDVQNSHNGYYADMETNCQVFHVCDSGRKVSFLCPNGTIFRQTHLICDWWFRVECERSPELYEQSIKHLQSEQPGFKQRIAAISNAMQNALSKGVTDSMLLESPVSVTNKLNEEFNSESELPRQRRPINRPTSYNQNQLSNTNRQSSFDQNQSSKSSFDQNQFSNTNKQSSFDQNQFSNTNRQPSFDQNQFSNTNKQPSFDQNQFSNTNKQSSFDQNKFSNTNRQPSFDQNQFSNTNRQLSFDQNQFSNTNKQSSFDQNQFSNTNRQPSFNQNQFSNTNRQPSFDQNQFSNTNKQSSFDQNQFSNTNRQSSFDQNQPSNTNRQSSFNQNQASFAPAQSFHQQSFTNTVTQYNQNQPTFSPQSNSQNTAPFNPTFSIDPTRDTSAGHGYTTPRVKFATDLSVDTPPPSRIRFNTLSFSPTASNASSSGRIYSDESYRLATTPKSISDAQNAALVSKARPFTYSTEFALNEISTPDTLDDYLYSPSPSPPSGTLLLNSPSRFSQSSPQSTATYSQTRNRFGSSQAQPTYTNTPTQVTSVNPGNFEPHFLQTQTLQNGSAQSTASQSNEIQEHQVLAETAAFAGHGKFQDFFYNPQNYIQPGTDKTTRVSPVQSTPNPSIANDLYKTTPYEPNNADPAGNSDAVLNLLNPSLASQPSDIAKPAVSQFLLNVTLADLNSKGTEPSVDPTLTSLLTNQTQEAYKQLFPQVVEEILSHRGTSDLQSEHSSGLVQSSSPKPAAQKSAPDVRELAQIFSRALSAYLEDPEQFRRILSEVRPTEPPATNSLKNEAEDEVLAFSEDTERSTPRPPIDVSTTTTRAIRDPETFAEEINNFMIAEPSQADTYPSSKSTIGVSFAVSPLIDYTTVSNTTDDPMTLEDVAPTEPIQSSQPTTPTFPPSRSSNYDDNDIGLVPPALPALLETNLVNRGYTSGLSIEQSKPKLENSYPSTFSSSATSVTEPISPFFSNGQTASTAPVKGSLYDEDNTPKPYVESPQSISDEQLLITADTQSFLSRDNLLAFNNLRPILKTPAYPKFGIRSKASSQAASQTYQTGNSRSYVIQTTPQTAAPSELASTEQPIDATDALPSSESNDWNTYATSESPLFQLSPPTATVFNDSSVNAMVNMMSEEVQTNPMLRSKLVLLLVNDRSLPQHKSVRDLKSKLLKALIIPPTIQTLEITQPELQQQQFAESRQYLQYQTTNSPPLEETTASRQQPLQQQVQPQQILQQPQQIGQLQQSQPLQQEVQPQQILQQPQQIGQLQQSQPLQQQVQPQQILQQPQQIRQLQQSQPLQQEVQPQQILQQPQQIGQLQQSQALQQQVQPQQILQQPQQIGQLQQSQALQQLQQQLQQQRNDISRDSRDTTLPAPVTQKSSNTECSNSVLSEADARAVDLLKTLYSIAANNWRQ